MAAEPGDAPEADGRAAAEPGEAKARGGQAETLFLLVTGGDDAPGKSTVAANIAQALVPLGDTAIFDADRAVPNARFYLGMPSWSYLSPLTGDGTPVQNAEIRGGLVVGDWSCGDEPVEEALNGGTAVYVNGGDGLRRRLSFAVVDAPSGRGGVIGRVARRPACLVVVARPGRLGFESAFGALKDLSTAAESCPVGLVVNRVPGDGYARDFHAKISAAAERLLSMEVALLGGVQSQPGMAALQRERGLIVTSRPDSLAALSLRSIASDAMLIAGERAHHRVAT
jgi:flagellar biosynthesis protein FlhG